MSRNPYTSSVGKLKRGTTWARIKWLFFYRPFFFFERGLKYKTFNRRKQIKLRDQLRTKNGITCLRQTARRRKKHLLFMYGNMCQGCYRSLKVKYLTVDHIVPISKGGKSDIENLQLLCVPCNQVKGNKAPLNKKIVGYPIIKDAFERQRLL